MQYFVKSLLKSNFPGNDAIVAMGARCTNELYVTLTYFDDTVKSATYSNFTLGPESDNYRLHLTGFTTGQAGMCKNVFILSLRESIAHQFLISETARRHIRKEA